MLRIAKYLVFLGIGLILLYNEYPPKKLGDILTDISHAKFEWIVLAIFCALASHVSRAARWNMLIRPLGYQPKLVNSFFSLMFGYMANTVVPRMGEVSRCVMLNRADKVPVSKLFGTVVVERIFDLIVLFIFLVINLIIEFDKISAFLLDAITARSETANDSLWIKLIVGFIVAAALLFVAWYVVKKSNFSHKIKELLSGFLEGVKTVKRMDNNLLFLFHTVFIWVMYYLMAYLCFFAVDATAHLGWQAGLTVFVMASLGFIMPSPGGIGTYHYMFIMALGFYGILKEDASVTAAIAHSANTLLNLFLGIIALIFISLKYKKLPANEPILEK